MTIDELADIYVDFVEPAMKLGAFAVLVIVVLHFLNILKTGGKSFALLGQAYQRLAIWLIWLIVALNKALRYLFKVSVGYMHIAIDTLREFLAVRK